MVSIYDYLNIAFYIAFITGVGIVFSRKSKNTSDYFRGGGVMPWWVAGASSWMASFSAWTFVGAAGEIYDEGPSLLLLYYSSLIPLLATLFYTCYRFRRMRVVTPIEGVRLRFGAGSQQFYTWIRLPLLFLFGGVGLNSVGTFMSGVFGINVILVMIILGIMVTFVALLGGSYSVVANDFVQMFLVVTVAVTVAALTLSLPAIGGVSGLITKAPHQAIHWNDIARSQFFLFFYLGLTLNNLFDMTRMDNSAKYLMAANDRHARKMVIIPLIGTLIGPLIWLIPPMAASILHSHSDMARRFPLLAPHPEHAAYLATALDVYFGNGPGGNKIGAPTSFSGSVKIDLTKVCVMIDGSSGTATCGGTYKNVSAAFGGASSLTINQILAYAASQSNSGGSVWYGQVKATQDLAKNTFDAINNGVALVAP